MDINMKSKHVDMCHDKISDFTVKGRFKLGYVSDDLDVADILTEQLDKIYHEHL